MIYLIFHGGLGNQFFQYAFGKVIQKKFNQKVCYISEKYKTDELRDLNITFFNIDPSWQAADLDYNFWSNHKIRRLLTKIISKVFSKLDSKNTSSEDVDSIYLLEHKLLNWMGFYTHYLHRYPPIGNSLFKDICIDGLWNDPRYFSDIRDELLHDLRLKEKLQGNNLELLNEIERTQSVCVHVRRGDYVYVKGYLVCTPYYYEEAMRRAEKVIDDPVFYIFSDDITWVKANIRCPEKTVYVDQNNKDYVDFSLMSKAKHFIISNSTYSWWAAYLGEADDKRVFVPDRWYNDGKTKNMMILKKSSLKVM